MTHTRPHLGWAKYAQVRISSPLPPPRSRIRMKYLYIILSAPRSPPLVPSSAPYSLLSTSPVHHFLLKRTTTPIAEEMVPSLDYFDHDGHGLRRLMDDGTIWAVKAQLWQREGNINT